MTAQEFILRPCAIGDMEAITSIYRHAVETGTGTFELDPPSQADMEQRFKGITGRGYPYLVAEAEGKIIGYAYGNAYRDRPAYRFLVEDSIYVAQGLQGKGIGRRLLEALMDECTARGFRQMIAVIGDSANRGSIRLHENAGFIPAGTIRDAGWKFDRWLDAVLMQRVLGEGATTRPVP